MADGKTQVEVAEILGVTKQTVSRTAIRLEQAGLIKCYPNSNPKRYYTSSNLVIEMAEHLYPNKFTFLRHRHLLFKKYRWTHTQKERIYGELLGDGSISPYYRFSLTSVSNEHVLYLKKTLPVGLFSNKTPYTYFPKNENWKTSYHLTSRTAQLFFILRHKWYPLGFKIVPNDLYLTSIICHHWYIGDGHLAKCSIVLATDCFLKSDVEFLVSQLCNNGFNAKLRLDKCRDVRYPRVVINQPQSFLEWIGENEISDYAYKWGAVNK